MARGMKREPKSAVTKRWRYFYMNDRLHRLLRLNRGKDEIIAWCYQDREKVIFSWSAVKKYGEPGKTNKQVADILNRHHITILKYLSKDWILRPERTYKIPDGTQPGLYIWSKKHILAAHDEISNINKGWPRADGFVNAPHLPTEGEVRMAANNDVKLYALNSNGEFVRLWLAEESNY